MIYLSPGPQGNGEAQWSKLRKRLIVYHCKGSQLYITIVSIPKESFSLSFILLPSKHTPANTAHTYTRTRHS